MKKVLFVLMLLFIAVFTMTSCESDKGFDKNDIEKANTKETKLQYVSFRINPEIELLLNEEEEVVDATAINEDGETVLEELELEGKTVDEAAVEFVEEAIEQGFYNEEDGRDTLYVDSLNEEGSENTEVETKVIESVQKYFMNNGKNGKVSKETLERYAEEAASWDVSTGKMKMIMRALDKDPTLVVEDLIEMDVDDLIAYLHDQNKQEKEIKEKKIKEEKEIKTKQYKEETPATKTDEEIDKVTTEEATEEYIQDKNEYKQNSKQLKEDYKTILEMNEEIDRIEHLLKDTELEESQRQELENQLNELKANFDNEQYNAYKNAANELKQNYKNNK